MQAFTYQNWKARSKLMLAANMARKRLESHQEAAFSELYDRYLAWLIKHADETRMEPLRKRKDVRDDWYAEDRGGVMFNIYNGDASKLVFPGWKRRG